MAQLGSILVTALNALIVSGKWNECSRASATSNCFCASALHVVLNWTLPSFAARAPAASSWAIAEAAKAKSDATASAVPVGFMTPPRAKDSAASLRLLVWENQPVTVRTRFAPSPTGYLHTVSYTHLRAHETPEHLVCRLLLEKKKK